MLFGKLFKKGKKQDGYHFDWYEVGTLEEKRRKLLDKIMIEYNPMFRIEIGRPNEVSQALGLAEKIVSPMGYSPQISADCKHIVSVFVLLCLYQSLCVENNSFYCFGTGYQGDYITACPTVDFLLRYFRADIMEEMFYEEDGKEKVGHKVATFSELVGCLLNGGYSWGCRHKICNLSFSDLKPVRCHLYGYEKNGRPVDDVVDDYAVSISCVMNRYREHNDGIASVGMVDTHPWVYRSLLSLSGRKANVLDERAYLCAVAVEKYLSENVMCSSFIVRDLFKRNMNRINNGLFYVEGFELDYGKILEDSRFGLYRNVDRYGWNPFSDGIGLTEER